MNAAGPWREDLENAPRDRDVLLCFQNRKGKPFFITAHMEIALGQRFVAWAEINQPENTNANDINTK